MNCISCFIIGFVVGTGILALLIFLYAYVMKKDIIDAYNRGKEMPENPEGDYVG